MEVFISLAWKVFIFLMDRRCERRGTVRKTPVQLRSEYLNFLRFSVTETAAATFTQLELDTNLSAERGIMMEIHSVDLDMPFDYMREVGANATEQTEVQITRETKTALINYNDSDVIERVNMQIARSAAIGTDAGPLYIHTVKPHRIDFALPIPYVKPSLFIGIQGTSGSAVTVRGRIGYTLRDISREEFLELLVALQ